MKIKIVKIIGSKSYEFEIDGKDFGDAYRQASKVDLIPSACSVCGSNDLSLSYRKPQGFEYPGVRCNACGASATIHTKKDNSEDYLSKMERYVPKNQDVPERDIQQETIQQTFPNTKSVPRPTSGVYGGQVGPSAFKN